MTLAVGTSAPPFSGIDVLTDQQFSLADHAGKCVVLIFSGLTWCPPCQAEAPHLAALWQELEGATLPPVQFVIVSVGDSDSLPAVADNFGITFPVVQSPGTQQAYDVSAVPTAYFIDSNGTICGVHVGFQGPADAFKDGIREELEHCGCMPKKNLKIDRYWAATMTILFGVTQDGGGIGITPGGKPIPIDPWGPLHGLGRHGQDAVRALAAAELATQLDDRASALAIRKSALTAARASIDAALEMRGGELAHGHGSAVREPRIMGVFSEVTR
jgi:peroxiredoxin